MKPTVRTLLSIIMATSFVAAAVATPASAAQPSDKYNDMLKSLQKRMGKLTHDTWTASKRLEEIKRRLRGQGVSASKLVVLHENAMGSDFKLMSVLYKLDDNTIYFQDVDSGLLDSERPIEVLNDNIEPGNHRITVEMVYRGDSSIFSYMRWYTFRLRAAYTVHASTGKITSVKTSGYLKGDITYDLTERPSIRFDVGQLDFGRAGTGIKQGPAQK